MHGTNAPEEHGSGSGEVHESPDFCWPFEVAELMVEWLGYLWECLTNNTLAYLRRRMMLRWALVFIALAGIAYLPLLWICLCYV